MPGEPVASVNKESRSGTTDSSSAGWSCAAAEPRVKQISFTRTPVGVAAFNNVAGKFICLVRLKLFYHPGNGRVAYRVVCRRWRGKLKQRVLFCSATTPPWAGFDIFYITFPEFRCVAAPLRATICRPYRDLLKCYPRRGFARSTHKPA